MSCSESTGVTHPIAATVDGQKQEIAWKAVDCAGRLGDGDRPVQSDAGPGTSASGLWTEGIAGHAVGSHGRRHRPESCDGR